MPSPLTRRYFVVRGRVQGVGFRWFVLQEAQELRVTGWVRNRPDGAVEGEVQGTEAEVAGLLAQVARGPQHSSVESLDTQERAPVKGERGFEIHH